MRGQRILVLALDGLDPILFARFSDESLLPHLTRLQREGASGKLLPVYPPVSPVVWTSFLTGLPPVAHGILDFVTKAPGEYRSTIGLYRVTRGADGLFHYRTRRLSSTLFHLLPPGDDFCLWLPATFPAESPPRRMLSGLGAPDLLATLGTSALYTTHPHRYASSEPSYVHRLEPSPTGWQGQVLGPGQTRHAFSVHQADSGVRLSFDDDVPRFVSSREWSPWLELHFALPGRSAHGLCRFKLLKTGEELAVYRTPLWCHPLDPLYPLAAPPALSASLCAEFGPFPTAGFAGDQLALRQGFIGRDTYLEDAYALWDAQATIARRLVSDRRSWQLGVIHFMTADALQHLFWRDYDPLHPAHDPRKAALWSEEIGRGYHWLDSLVAELVSLAGPDTLVVVLSDHGVVPLYRRVDINGWLHQRGYLVLRGEEVDWASSQAFAFGHGGIWLNLKGRESQGCVSSQDYALIRTQLMAALRSWRDPGTETPVMRAVWRWEASRPGRDRGLPTPDIGFALTPGFGLERGNLVGHVRADQHLIRPNHGAWSGGHEGPYRPTDVPGVLILHGPSIPAGLEFQNARIVDLAPTLLHYLGAEPPVHLGGRSLLALPS